MSRINTNINSLIAQRVLGQQQTSLTKTLERLSTGYRINRGADDPAGLIASEKLRSELAATEAALANAERADQVVNIAEGGLQEVGALLTELQSLVSQCASDAGLSIEEKEANQLQIDSILQTIDRIASTTSFEGVKLLNGQYDYTVSGVDSSVEGYQINTAKFNDGESLAVNATVTASAQHASLFLSFGDTVLTLGSAGNTFVFEVMGAKGSRQFSFGQSATLDSIASAINTFADVTGVSANAAGSAINLMSTDFGSASFVSVKLTTLGGQTGNIYQASATDETTLKPGSAVAFTAAGSGVRDDGQDIQAIVNGIQARGDGKKILVNSDQLAMELILDDTASQTLATTGVMTITGGGARFNLGPTADLNNLVTLGLPNVATRNLGSVTNGYLSTLASGGDNNVVNGDLTAAQNVVNDAIDQVSALRGRLGAFQKNVVGATIRSLGVAIENTSAAESAIRDTDFAEATAQMARNQILVQASSQVLSIANTIPQNVLLLLQ